jgi:hypothetical protein
MPSTTKGTTSGVSVSGPKVQTMECSGRTQRKLPGSRDPAPHRIDFGQGKLRMIPGRSSASASWVVRPGRSITAT